MFNFLKIGKALAFGCFTGITISIPLGPSAIESVNRTISKGFKEGFSVSLGAISADMTYLILINCGFSNLLMKSKKTQSLFWIISGIILMFMGYKSLNNKKGERKNVLFKNKSFPFISGYIITLSNPMTPTLWLGLSATALKTWCRMGKSYYYSFIFAILVGMIIWFTLLNIFALKGIKLLNNKTNPKKASNLVSWGTLLLGLGFSLYGLILIIPYGF